MLQLRMKRIVRGVFAALLLSTALGGTAHLSRAAAGVEHVEVGGAKLCYIERGNGEPVVFVHGALGDYRTWAAQMEPFSRHFKVISYSRRYHFPNDWTGDGSDYSRTLHAGDLAALLRALKLGPAHLVGHSYGAAVAAAVAAKHPELVRSLVLGEPSLFAMLQGPEDKTMLAQEKWALDAARDLLQEGKEEEAVRAYLKAVVGTDVLDQLPAASRSVLMDNARTLGPMLETYFIPMPLRCSDARRMETPVLLITGEFSPKTYRLIADALMECLPNAKRVVLSGASHGLQSDKPQEFNEAVLEFLMHHGGETGSM